MRKFRRGLGVFLVAAVLTVLGGAWTVTRADPVPEAMMLAIVQIPQPDPGFLAQWTRLREHKGRQGILMEIVTLESILAGPDHAPQGQRPSIDNAEKVKNYLRWRKGQPGGDLFRFCLVGADFDDRQAGGPHELFPVRYSSFVMGTPGEIGYEGHVPVTLPYYADLSNEDGSPSTWDDDGDAADTDGDGNFETGFAEPGQDRISLFANPEEGDVFVGYLPICAAYPDELAVLTATVDKIIAYEDPADPNGGFPGRAYPSLSEGNYFLRPQVFGGNTWPAGDRNGERDARAVKRKIFDPACLWTPNHVRFDVVEHYLTPDLAGQPGRFPYATGENVVRMEDSVRYCMDQVNAGAGFVFNAGHGDFTNMSTYNDPPNGALGFPIFVTNWTHPAYGPAAGKPEPAFTNHYGPYPIVVISGCNMGWTDAITNYPNVPPWVWGEQCLAEVLFTQRYHSQPGGPENPLPGDPAFRPKGAIAVVSPSRSQFEDTSFPQSFFLAYSRGRASRLGELVSEAHRICLNRQDIIGNDPTWSCAGGRANTGEYFYKNAYMMTYVGDPSLKIPKIGAVQPLSWEDPFYADRAADLGLGGLSGNLTCVAVADLDGDRIDDLVLGADQPTDWRVRVYRGVSGGGYAQATQLPNGSDEVLKIAVGDVNGDGNLDLFVGTRSADRLYLKDAGWGFAEADWGVAGSGPTTQALFSDLDVDGKPDLMVVEGGAFKAYRNTGTAFVDRTIQWISNPPLVATAIAVGDANVDGLPDLFVGGSDASRFYAGETEGVWKGQTITHTSAYAEGAQWEDLDGDACAEIHVQLLETQLYATGSRAVPDAVYRLTPSGLLALTGTAYRGGGIFHCGETRRVSFGDVDFDGRVDAAYFNRFGTQAHLYQDEAGPQGRWTFKSRVPTDGIDYTEEMRDGALVDAGSGRLGLVGIRNAGHLGASPRSAVRYWVDERHSAAAGRNPPRPPAGAENRQAIRLRLRGAGTPGMSPLDPVGARVYITSTQQGENGEPGATRTQVREVSRNGHSEGILFGVGQIERLDSVWVQWPSGRSQFWLFPQWDLSEPVEITEAPHAQDTRPAAVSGLSVQTVENPYQSVDLRLTWNAVPGATYYEIWKSVDGGPFLWQTVILAQGPLAYLDPIGQDGWGRQYNYRVRAVNNWGTGSWGGATTGPLVVEPRPNAPVEAGVVRHGTVNHLNWSPVQEGHAVESYNIYRMVNLQWTLLSTLPATQFSYIDPDGNGYSSYLVEAENAWGKRSASIGGRILDITDPGHFTLLEIRIDPPGGPLNVPAAGTPVQLRCSLFFSEEEGGIGSIPLTYLCAWSSNNPSNPISQSTGFVRLICNASGATGVTARFDPAGMEGTANYQVTVPGNFNGGSTMTKGKPAKAKR